MLTTLRLQRVNLLDHGPYRAVYETNRLTIAQKGQRASEHKDPQEGVSQEAPTPAEYTRIVEYHHSEDPKLTRNLSMFTLMSSSLGRWASQLHLPFMCCVPPPAGHASHALSFCTPENDQTCHHSSTCRIVSYNLGMLLRPMLLRPMQQLHQPAQ